MVVDIENQYKMGFMTDHERYKQVVQVWEKTTDEVSTALQENLDRYNPIFMMADSGARGSMKQIRQLAGMRGLIANTAGKTIEIPIKANYREGLTALEYFISSRGARKGLADTALRTACLLYTSRAPGDADHQIGAVLAGLAAALTVHAVFCHVFALVAEVPQGGHVVIHLQDVYKRQTYSIAVIGDWESVMGFRALGLDTYPVTSVEEARKTVHDLAKTNCAVM